VLRAANATLDEGRTFARYLDTAAEGFFRFWLGRNAVEMIATAYLEPDHDLSYQNVVFAERNEIIVGMASGYTAEEHRRSSDRPLRRAVGFSPRMMCVAVLCAPLLRVLDTVADGDFYLQAIAVDEELRGEGVGTALMDWIENRAVASGSVQLVLDVAARNERARRIYERRGMFVTSRWPERLPLPGLRLVRLAKPL